jgi:rhodanese-related sulfurtransferase
MRKTLALAVTLLLTGAVASAQMKTQPQAGSTSRRSSPVVVEGVRRQTITSFPRISVADAKKLYQQDKAVFIDVRANSQFLEGHIKGALGIPGSQIMRRFREVPVKKTVIAYCACSAEQLSGRAAMEMIAHGIKNVYALKGGWDEWKAAGLPTARGPK